MHVYVRIEPRWTFDEVRRAALALAREVERRAPALATSKWWKEERHGVFLDYNQNAKDRTVAARVLGAADGPTRACRRRSRGTRSTTAIPATSRWRRCRRASRAVGDRHAGIDDAAGSLDALLELSARHEKRGPGRCAVAAALPKQAGEADARAAVAAARAEASADRDRPRAARKTTRSRGSSDGRRAIPRRRRICEPADVLVDAMRGRFHTWTRMRVNLQHVPEATAAGAGSAGSGRRRRRLGERQRGRRGRAEDLLELVRRRDLELIVAAVARRLVGPPAQKDRRVAEAIALQVVVLHLADALDAQRLPRQILARAPAALPARHARRLAPPASAHSRHGMAVERAARAAARARCASSLRVAIVNDEVTPTWCSPLLVVEPEQQRADQHVLARLVPAEAGDDAVGGARVLDLEHRALARLIGASAGLAMTPSSPAPSKRASHSAATPRSRVIGVRWTRRLAAAPAAASSARAALVLRRRRADPAADREQVERDERRRRRLRRASRRATPRDEGAAAARRSRGRAAWR